MNTKFATFLGLLAIALFAVPNIAGSPTAASAVQKEPAVPQDVLEDRTAACMYYFPAAWEVCLAAFDAGLLYCDGVKNKWARWACYAALVIL